jgi:hypothetical protein
LGAASADEQDAALKLEDARFDRLRLRPLAGSQAGKLAHEERASTRARAGQRYSQAMHHHHSQAVEEAVISNRPARLSRKGWPVGLDREAEVEERLCRRCLLLTRLALSPKTVPERPLPPPPCCEACDVCFPEVELER